MASLRAEIVQLETRLIKWEIGLALAVAGVTTAAVLAGLNRMRRETMQTMKRTTLALATALALSFAAIAVSAQDDGSLGDTAEALAKLLRAVEILSAVEKSILLTDQDCEDLGRGWTNYEQLGGRFALASGKGEDDSQAEEVFELYALGGTYKHLLTEPEMPSHQHAYQDRTHGAMPNKVDHGDDRAQEKADNERTTEASGGNEPHNNMPPYMVLNFCHRQ